MKGNSPFGGVKRERKLCRTLRRRRSAPHFVLLVSTTRGRCRFFFHIYAPRPAPISHKNIPSSFFLQSQYPGPPCSDRHRRRGKKSFLTRRINYGKLNRRGLYRSDYLNEAGCCLYYNPDFFECVSHKVEEIYIKRD